MPVADSGARGFDLLRDRVARAPAAVAALPDVYESLLACPDSLPRVLVTTGIGTSEAHARHLAYVANRFSQQPARFVSTGALERGPGPGAQADWLVVFSQGLSANARFALVGAERWGGVVVVTGMPSLGTVGFDELEPGKRAALQSVADVGGVVLDMGCGAEYGALVRVIGARAGYGVAWALLRSLAARRLEPIVALATESLEFASAQREAAEVARAQFETSDALAAFFSPDRAMAIVVEDGAEEAVGHLALKISEGMLRPKPDVIGVSSFAHGPLQSLSGRPASFIYLTDRKSGEAASDWCRRFESGLDPAHHLCRRLPAVLPPPFQILEYEAAFDEWILALGEESTVDLVRWPGREREEALYSNEPVRKSHGESSPRSEQAEHRIAPLEEAVWPEVEAALLRGQRSAILPLGSTEQHGPHLPMGTDTWIAGGLAKALAERVGDAIALPPLALGCASEHLAFPGTLSLRPETLEAVLADVLESLARHGFERVFLLTAHGGNVAALRDMTGRLAAHCSPMRLRIESDLDAVATMQSQAVAAEGLDPEHAGPHAGEFETSVVAAIRSGSVRVGALEAGVVLPAAEAQGLFMPDLRAHAERGVVGDPRAASAERGERYLRAWVDLLEARYWASDAETGPADGRRE